MRGESYLAWFRKIQIPAKGAIRIVNVTYLKWSKCKINTEIHMHTHTHTLSLMISKALYESIQRP